MAYNLKIVDSLNGISFNAKYTNMSTYKSPPIVAKTPEGKKAKESTVYQGKVLGPGSTQRSWVDEDGKVWSKAELTFEHEGEEVQENSQTKVFEVETFEELSNYTDKYIIDKYYELFPSNDGLKKDADKAVAVQNNLSSMHKLWEFLTENDIVARGEFCVSSRGFIASDGYIRAIRIAGEWGLEIGVFKEAKTFEHLTKGTPKKAVVANTTTKKRLKMV